MVCHPEHHLIVLGGNGCLFGDDRCNDDVIVAWIGSGHANRASNACKAALVSTSLCRRRMSYTLIPCTGRTSMLRILRAACTKLASTCDPSIMRALLRPSFSKLCCSALVLPSDTEALSSTMMPPSLALAESACLSASARTFFGRSIAWLRGFGPNER